MIPSEKELTEALLQACESLFVQNLVLKQILRKARVADWRGKLDSEANSVVASLAHEVFQKRYEQAIRTQQELKKFVESLPSVGAVQ